MSKFSIRLIGLCGLIGVIILITSFIINPGPGANPTLNQLIQFKKNYFTTTIIGSWMQAISPPLIVSFASGLIYISRKNGHLIGTLTFLGGIILLMISMIEVTFYFSTLTGTSETTGMISMQLISSVQRLYSIIAAPFLFITLSTLLFQSKILPKFIVLSGFILGSVFFILGIIQLFLPIQNTIDVLSMIQGIWWLVSALLIIIRSERLAF